MILCVCFELFFFCLCFPDRNEHQLEVPVCKLVVITTAIPLLLFPCFLAVSEIFSHSDTCAVPSVCDRRWFAHLTRLHLSSASDDKNCELFTPTLVLQCSPLSSLRQPQTTHVFADSRITLLCRALRICVAHAPTESCLFSLVVH